MPRAGNETNRLLTPTQLDEPDGTAPRWGATHRMKAHRDGAGARKIATVLGEFKRGTLHSGSGATVRSRPQALAIALSEARRAGARIPRRR